MALEAVVFHQDPFSYGVSFQHQQQKSNYCNTDEMLAPSGGFGFGFGASWGRTSSSSLLLHQNIKEWPWGSNSSSPDIGFATVGSLFSPTDSPPVNARPRRRRRRRAKMVDNRQEKENQRMTHIAVERNRRRQMNDYLAEIRSMMPNSYVQRGDQASIIGGAINFVKELEQFLQSLEARKRMANPNTSSSSPFSYFFSFSQYSTASTGTHHGESLAKKRSPSSSSSSSVADVEVTMMDSHANVKIRSKKHPKQLFRMVSGIHALGLMVLHLNVTSVENTALYSFSVKIEEKCQLTTVDEVAVAVYEMVDRLQEEAAA
ncbi:hypothetical protein V6N13_111297 [Hibiscus sabdariffa]|uniref:BHLH domain-containing protein n=1 Tax=Hibiscus sabdariffa TaxID=183260 RepID=A0ABR2TJT2_9ROSI